jgi:Mg2+ and Co2+ transporter CorA
MLIPQDWDVPAVFRQRLGDTVGKQRVMAHDGDLFLVLHKLPDPSSPERQGVLFWRQPTGQWLGTPRGDGLQMLRRHLEEFDAAVDALEGACDKAVSAADHYTVIQRITPLHRTISHLYATLQSAREAVPNERELILLRDRAGEIDRAADILQHEAIHGLQFRMAQRAEDLSQSSHDLAAAGHKLNTLAALFLPMTAVATMMGMNLRHGLEGYTSPILFWSVVAGALGLGFFLRGAVIRR